MVAHSTTLSGITMHFDLCLCKLIDFSSCLSRVLQPIATGAAVDTDGRPAIESRKRRYERNRHPSASHALLIVCSIEDRDVCL